MAKKLKLFFEVVLTRILHGLLTVTRDMIVLPRISLSEKRSETEQSTCKEKASKP